MSLFEFSKEKMIEALKQSNEEFLDDLCERFSKDLLYNMVFFLFNVINNQTGLVEDKKGKKYTLADQFIKTWTNETKKKTASEMEELNEFFLQNKQNAIMQAICDYSLPSTEDFQGIYKKATQEVIDMFNQNMNPVEDKGSKEDDEDDYD